jgi:TRAP-type C4-dicarboxylate transport system substrate-binding protein
VIPARAWDVLGVTTLDALHAPLLVDSHELVARIVGSDIENDLLAGLDPLGIVGLALVPESLRHPFSFDRPLLAPGDYDGRTYWAPRSEAVWATLRALGADPDDPSIHDLHVRVRDGAITAADADFGWAAWLLPRSAIATANVTLYPKLQSLVINREVFDRLTTGDQEALRLAGAATRDWALSTMSASSELVRHFCAHGGEIVLVSEADLAALAIAVKPVVESMQADRTTASLIARIRELKAALGDGVGSSLTCGD